MLTVNLLNGIYNVRFISTAIFICAKNHYDSLGISPKATQHDVKSAYYKLSLLYHPDKNQKHDSSEKFRDITEAYEVLGNTKLRRLYDKGIFHVTPNVYDTDVPGTKFYKSRERRARPPSTGRTPIYNFDEWTRAHYGETFAREMELKRNIAFRAATAKTDKEEQQIGRFQAAIFFCFAMYLLLSVSVSDVDKPVIERQTPKTS